MSAHILPPLTVNSKSERKVNSLSPLGFEPVIFRMLAHLSDHSAKSHPQLGAGELSENSLISEIFCFNFRKITADISSECLYFQTFFSSSD
jgi:hypothetical protein